MPVPDYESLMLPLLQLCGDGKPYKIDEVCAHHCAMYQTTKSDPILVGRFHTARICLAQANLLESPTAKNFQITPSGKKLLKSPPEKITRVFLRRYPAFVLSEKNSANKSPKTPPAVEPRSSPVKSPNNSPAKPVIAVPGMVVSAVIPSSLQALQRSDEPLAQAYCQLQKTLTDELLCQIRLASSQFFEKLVIDLLVAMGYGKGIKDAAQIVGGSGDGGIDGIIKEDPLGLGTVYVQAKKRDGISCVGSADVQKFIGALQGRQPCKGVFLTTGRFTDEAKEFAKSSGCKVALIDGELLVKYMIDFQVGVSVRQTYQIKKIDTDYFSEE